MRFHARIELDGKTATGIRVPAAVVESLGAKKRVPVRVTIGGHSYRSTIAPMGGEFLIPVSAENRKGAGVVAGDEVDVDIEVDTEPREVAVPADLAEAMAGDGAASAFFAGLTYSQKRGYTTWIEDAKRAETRQRRVESAVTALRERRTQH